MGKPAYDSTLMIDKFIYHVSTINMLFLLRGVGVKVSYKLDYKADTCFEYSAVLTLAPGVSHPREKSLVKCLKDDLGKHFKVYRNGDQIFIEYLQAEFEQIEP